ncbi:unnamed protein product [Cylindrotheca closterium]|uniref:Uncharacterized protein n=1 Tax=Cylindrotheca closterium TaxID=2856 RepID=A0AAD2JNI8_9STRA|nr:unnamed protein product [Cylindrotheca closterium]
MNPQQHHQQQQGESAISASNASNIPTGQPAATASNPISIGPQRPDSAQRNSSRGSQRSSLQLDELGENWAEVTDVWEANVAQPSRKALREFFYPSRQSLQNNDENQQQQSRQQYAEGGGSNAANPSARSANPQTIRNASSPTSNGALSPSTFRQPPPSIAQNPDVIEQERQDKEFVEDFWTIYDDIIILSLFTQIGIICRLGVAYSFRVLDAVFRQGSALFTNLPLNCFSCFVMGLLCSGESLMEIVSTRFSPPRLQHDLHQEARQLLAEQSMDEEDMMDDRSTESLSSTYPRFGGTQARRRKKKNRRIMGWRPKSDDFYSELREVQLLALERRIRASPCLVLFHVRKEDVDLVENYFNNDISNNKNEDTSNQQTGTRTEENDEGNDGERFSLDEHDLVLEETQDDPENRRTFAAGQELSTASLPASKNANKNDQDSSGPIVPGRKRKVRIESRAYAQITQADSTESAATPTNAAAAADPAAQPLDLEQIVSNVATDVSQQISQLSRVTLADGWDVGTTPDDKKKDLMLGLRDGLCGALSSFSSWISAMVSLLRDGKVGEACVGIVIGIQLPIVAYRFGQHVAVCVFVWRCRRETKRDERRGGYGIRLSTDEEDDIQEQEFQSPQSGNLDNPYAEDNSETPSVRAVITALFVISVVAQVTSLNFYYEPDDRLLAFSLLFSPLGVLTRWRLSRYNSWRPNFPIGTFTCNILACALSGTLGNVLAGNPGPTERIALVALIAGFGGTLSSVARFIVEMLAGVDPILLRIDGAYYGMISIFCGLLVSFVFTASGDWADTTGTDR